MARYALTVRQSDNAVLGTWRGGDRAIPSLHANDPNRIDEVTQAVYEQVTAAGTSIAGAGVNRFTYDGVALSEVTDQRPLLTASPDVSIQLEGAVGPPVNITLTLAERPGNPVLDFTGDMDILLSDGRSLFAQFVSNVVSIPAARVRPYDVRIVSTEDYEVVGEARVKVRAVDFQPD